MNAELKKLPEVFVSNKKLATFVHRETKQGNLRKLASRLYTRNLLDKPEDIIKRNVWHLVASYFPGALIADRTALEYKPSIDGSVFIISDKKRSVKLPGISIIPRKGAKVLESDKPFISGLFLSSRARAFLENIRVSRARSMAMRRTLTRSEIEEKLDVLLRHSGSNELQNLRDEAKELAAHLNLSKEYRSLSSLIGTLLGTKNEKLSSEVAKMRTMGMPYDPIRLSLFQLLFESIMSAPPIIRLIVQQTGAELINLSFFESYFSNFIEGTEFRVDEAESIVFKGKIPKLRPEDAHDVLGTYSIVSDNQEMQKTPRSFEEFLEIMKSRHAIIMAFRPDKNPGLFKTESNRAGSTLFVNPELVEGTLYKGFEFYQSLETAFAKAVFMMFLVSEVHPFTDGNGRLARIMMNAELIAKKEQRIIIPTIYRNNYLASLKALSLSNHTDPLIRTLDFAQKYTAAIDWSDLNACRHTLEATNAFRDPYEADTLGVRLKLP